MRCLTSPRCDPPGEATRLLAASCLAILGFINCYNVKWANMVQVAANSTSTSNSTTSTSSSSSSSTSSSTSPTPGLLHLRQGVRPAPHLLHRPGEATSSPLTPHPSSCHPLHLTHPSPLTPHPSTLTPHPSPLTPHPSPLTPHPSPLLLWPGEAGPGSHLTLHLVRH